MGDIKSSEWSQNWRVVASASVGLMVGTIHAYSIGVMVAPLQGEFGWSRAQVTSGLMITSVMTVVMSPLMGMAFDRFGPRRMAILGVSAYAAAIAMLSQAQPSIWSWWLLWWLLSLALLFIKPTVWVTAITSLFDRRRGMALAIVLSASGLSQAFLPLLTFGLIERFGWRAAFAILGASGLVLALPMLIAWFTSAHDKLRLVAPESRQPASNARLTGLSIGEGLRGRTFYQLAIGAISMSVVGSSLTINLIPVLTGNGISRASAAQIAIVTGIAAIAGRLTGGYLLDRYDARKVGAVAVLLPILSCGIFLAAPASASLAIVAALFIGLAAGAEMDAISYMAGRCFGLRNFGMLFGTLMGIMTLGIGLGPNLANLVFDATQSYRVFLWCVIPLSLLSSLAFLTVGRYPDFADPE